MSTQAHVVETVLGPVAAEALGPALTHEHLFVGWPGWNLDPLAEDARETQYAALLDRLRAAYALGLRTIVDASPPDLGRSLPLLQRISRDSGLHVVASTGVYHESWGFPVYLKMRSIDELAAIFVHDLTQAADGSSGRAGVIKVASAGSEIGRHERRALLAAAQAQQQSGAAIITHSANSAVALDQARTLIEAGAAPDRVQIGHCDTYPADELLPLLESGVFVAFDQVVYTGKIGLEERAATLASLLADGWARQLTLSHDQIGILGGRQVPLAAETRSFTYIWDVLLPRLRARGVAAHTLETVMIDNPRRLLGGSVG